jgi:hypothetical protein
MLRFLENHDEQRIASEEFGKNPGSALAAMMLSATLHKGPIMLYYGQELGVKPTQAEGFQGNDGRTTIFDFWGVIELQNWINKDKFDTKKLSKEQKALRDFYQKILKFSQDNPAVSDGEFHDLQYLNFHSDGYDSSKVYSYLRFTKGQLLLFVYNFDLDTETNVKVSLPHNVLESEVGNVNEVKLKQVFEGKEKQRITLNKSQTDFINLKPNSFKIFEITKP